MTRPARPQREEAGPTPSFAPYAPRAVRFLGLWTPARWRLKLYGIGTPAPAPEDPLLEPARRAADRLLPRPALADGRYGVGFLALHRGAGANVAFVDWWARENELHHRLLLQMSEAPPRFRPAPADAFTGCVWDLGLLAFERDAWVRTVLDNPRGPDLDAYLQEAMEGLIR